ncbi:MAG: DUF6056 family protein [Clostridiaceae bacterium]|nr:DUF6056 family protein [Clostridiaceae bacterium]MDY5889216.1 DUF6056 family protein [Oscillospiraceae bacterium]
MRSKKLSTFATFCIAATAFYLIFTRLVIKTDDGHFIAIMSESGFDLIEWLKLRFETWSGRITCEFLTMKFLSVPLIFWKITASLIWIFIVWFIIKLISAFGVRDRSSEIFAVCIPFTVFIGCLNPGAFWFTGSMFYLFPFGAMTAVVLPAVFDVLNIKYRRIPFVILSAVAGLLACSQEQTAALTVGFYSVLMLCLAIGKRLKPYHFAPIPFAVFSTYLLFSAPGMAERMKLETGKFERFADMNFFEKLFCGLSNYFAFGFMMSAVVFGLLIVLIVIKLNDLYRSKAAKALSCLLSAFAVFSFVGGNVLSLATNGSIPDKAFEKMFSSGETNAVNIIIIAVCFVTLLLVVSALIMIMRKQFKTGFSALLCFFAGVCSAVVVGFSSSVYASGQRIFFFSELLTLIACAILFSSAEKDRKTEAVGNVTAVISTVMCLTNCFVWFFLEIPIMG